MQLAQEKGVVTIHRAYSLRAAKVYVQHFIKMMELSSAELLDKGAYLYLRDGKVMAPDVEATLIETVSD